MDSVPFVVAVALVASTMATPAFGQLPETHASAAELAAARAMLARPDIPKGRAAIEPNFALDGHAPGAPLEQNGRRPASRTAAVAKAIGGVVEEEAEIGTCPGCVALRLTLSDPVISGDTAFVTATASYLAGPEFPAYETVRFTLVRRGGSWHVREAVQLGVT